MSNLVSTLVDAGTPLNNALFQSISSNLTGKRVGDLMGEIAVKGDMAGRTGATSGAAPDFGRGRSSRWYAQRRQPQDVVDVPDYQDQVNKMLPPAPQVPQQPTQPAPAQQQSGAIAGPGQAGSPLADLLQQRKK